MAVCCPPTQVEVSQWRKRGVRKRQRSVHHQAGSRPRLRSVSAKPNSRQRCSLTWQISVAGQPPSKSVGCSRPDALQFEPCDVGDSCCFAKDKQPSVTRGSHSAWSWRRHQSQSSPGQASSRRSHHKAMCLLAHLSTLPKYLQSWQQFWTSPEAHARSRKRSEWIQVWQQRRRNTPLFSTAADQEGEGGRQGLNGHAHVQRIQRTRYECPGVIIPGNLGAGNVTQRSTSSITVLISELCEESS